MALKRPRDRKAFEIAIICTSPLEADVMLPILDQTWQGDEDLRKTSGDKNGYTCGSVGKHYVVLVRLPEMGGIDVTTAARAVNMSFPNVQLAVVTGMYGGIPKPAGSENIRLGDLITRHAVAQYDFERQYPTGIRGRAGVLDLLGHPSPLMRSFLAKLQAEEYYENYREIPINVYESANTVIKSGLDHDEVAQHTDPIAQKMAGAGAWNSFPCCLVVKSVCDYADNHKSKEWETYAATVAAAGAKALLQELQSPKQFSTTSTSTTSVNKHWMVQRPNKVMFTGREAELKRLRDILDIYLSTDNQEDQYRIVVTGVGGIGKSELCTRITSDFRKRYWAVFWIGVNSKAQAEAGYSKLAQKLGLEGTTVPEVLSKLNDISQNFLLILDNADDSETDYQRYFPSSSHSTVILTSRNVACGKYTKKDHHLTLETLETSDDEMLPHRTIEGISATTICHDYHNLQGNFRLLAGHTPGIIQGSTSIARGSSAKKHISDFQNRGARLLQSHKRQISSRHRSICATFEASVDLLIQSSTELLSILAILHWPVTQSSFLSLQNGFKDVVRAGDNVVLQGLWQPFLTAWHVENLPGWMYDILKPHEGTTSSSNEPFYIVSESTNAIADVQSSYTQLDRIAAATGLLNRLSLTTLASSGTSKLISMHPLVHAWARERQQHLEREAPWITTACLITDVLGDTPYPRFREGALTIHLAALAEGIPVESLLHDATSEILVATELQLLWRAIQFHCSAANELMKHITGTYNAHTATHICPPRESNEHGARRSVQILSQSAAMLLTAASSPRAAEIVATYVRTRVRLFFSLTLDLNRAEPPYGRDGARFNRLSHIAASDWLRFAKVSQIQRTKIRIEPLLALLLDRVRALSYARDELDRASSKPILDQTHVKTGDMDEDAGLLKLVRRALQIVSLDSGVVGKEKRQTARTLPVLLRMRRETCRYCVARTSTIGMPGDSVARNETASEKLRKRQLKHTFSDSSSKDVPRMSVSSAGEDGTSVSSSTHNDPEWAQELTAMGYSDQEIAELLLQQASEAPWIFGDDEIITMNDSSTSWHLDFHRRSCAHRYGEGVTNAGDSLADQALYSREQDAESRKVKEALDNILGLAGVQPCRQQSGGWVSGVKFLCNNTSCAISYLEYRIKDEERHSFHLERIKNSIKRTLQGIAILQNAGMCCDSITAIIDNDHQGDRIVRRAISLHPITLHTILDFRVSLDQILTDDTPNDITKKTFHALSHFLTPFLGEDLPDVDPLSLCAIVAQYLSLACLSYSRAHIGSIRTKFLDTAQDAFHLLGLGHTELLGSSNACIAARLLPLECLGRLTEQPVLAFSWRSRWGDLKQATEGRYHLSCKMDSFLDTFGPGQLIRRVSPSGEIEQAVAMAVGGGLLVAITEDSSHVSQRDVPATITDTSSRRGTSDREGDVTIAHWTCEDDIDLSKLPPLDLMARFLIGSPITINNGCQQDISASRTRLVPNMRHLGTGRPYWRPSERQLAAQVGQYVVVQAMQTATKIEGVTLKEICLAGQDRDIIEFLEGPWGLQVSACTRVSRRVSLRELVHDLLPIFTNNAVVLNDADWQALQACQVYDALSYDVQCWKQWLEALTNECRAFLVDSVRQILRSLQHTGVSKDGSYFLIAWPHPGCTQSCLEISCQPKENQWLCVLADSMDCATFAYVTSKCLESEHSSCSAQPFWLNSITALGTAVSRLYCAKVSHGSCPSPFPPKLDVEKEYWLTKMNTVLRIAVSRSQNAATTYLHASKSKLPWSLWLRVKAKEKHGDHCRIREQVWHDEQIQHVLFLSSSPNC